MKQIAFKAALNLEEKRDGQTYVVRAPSPCQNCGGPVNPLTSWIHLGTRVCSRGCYHDVGGKP